MPKTKITPSLEQVELYLDREKDALLSGQIENIPELLEEKETLLAALKTSETNQKQKLQELRLKASRNQLLLDGALEGIRDVAQRLATFRTTRRNLETYDQSGRKSVINGDSPCHVEKRA